LFLNKKVKKGNSKSILIKKKEKEEKFPHEHAFNLPCIYSVVVECDMYMMYTSIHIYVHEEWK